MDSSKIQKGDFDHVILGPEFDKRFEVRHPQNLKVGYKTVMSGDLLINAMGGRNRKVLSYRERIDNI